MVRPRTRQHARSTPATHKEEALSSKQSKRKRTAGQAPSSQSVRQEKRAQFEQPKKGISLYALLGVVALIAVVAIAAVVVMSRNGGGAEAATATAAQPSGDVTIPVSQVKDGKAHFYSYDAGGTTVRYFILADKNGKVRAALDACEVCYAQKKGYHQQGDAMQCNNCGRVFPSSQINVITGGCNPIPLDKTISGGKMTITTDSLSSGAQYF
jgi:uncharacterized membrane protein